MRTKTDRDLDDGSAILAMMDGDPAAAKKMAMLFFETGAEQIEAMIAAADRDDAEGVVFNAHKCAGGAAACGLERLASELLAFEHEARDMDWEQAMRECRRLESLFAECRANVALFFDDKAKGGSNE